MERRLETNESAIQWQEGCSIADENARFRDDADLHFRFQALALLAIRYVLYVAQ